VGNIAIITARGGSKRIPKKNIREFCGKPIIAYSILAALESAIFDEVMVSTDSEEIAEIAREYGAKVPFMRSAETSSDFATTADVINEVIAKYKELGKEFDYISCIYPTAPFITPKKLIAAMELIKRDCEIAEVMPVVAFSYPPQRCYVIDEEGDLTFKYPQYMNSRTQDLEKQYHDAGQFYIYNAKKYVELDGVIKENIRGIIVSELEVQDIDNEQDWILAEAKHRIMNEMM
jgi:N-acylneuraminate cytidylyltransferase